MRCGAERSAVEHARQRRPVDQFHDEVRERRERVGVVASGVEDHDQARVAQSGQQPHLAAAAHVAVGQHAVLAEDLDRHRAVEHGVAGPEHLRHAAAAEQFAEYVPSAQDGSATTVVIPDADTRGREPLKPGSGRSRGPLGSAGTVTRTGDVLER